jgi:hypothetical protein
VIAEALAKVSEFLKRIRATAEQLTQTAGWRLILSTNFRQLLRRKVLGGNGQPSTQAIQLCSLRICASVQPDASTLKAAQLP